MARLLVDVHLEVLVIPQETTPLLVDRVVLVVALGQQQLKRKVSRVQFTALY